jgi:hypothetical protein
MTYSYTQISQYLTCPRRYRHRYLDGWKEKDTRRPGCSVAPSDELWVRCFAVKTPERSCSTSGLLVRTKDWRTPTETLVTACFDKESCC